MHSTDFIKTSDDSEECNVINANICLKLKEESESFVRMELEVHTDGLQNQIWTKDQVNVY